MMKTSINLKVLIFSLVVKLINGNSAPVFENHVYPDTLHFSEGTATPSGTTLHTFTITDADGAAFDVTYTFSPSDSEDLFTTTANTVAGTYSVALASGETFDYETQNSYTITAKAFDGVDSATALITIEIDDVGEAPTLNPDTPVQIFTINESKATTFIGVPSFEIDDLDDFEQHTFSINSTLGTGFDYIIIDPNTGTIRLKQDYDREVPGTPADVWIHVDITDKFGLSATTTFSVIVNDLNDNTPYFTINEVDITIDGDTTTGTALARLEANDDDADSPNNNVTLTVDDSDTGNYFEMDGSDLKMKIYLDVPDGTSGLTFKVYAVDGGSPARTGTATINVILPAATTTTTTTLIPPVGYSWLDDNQNTLTLAMICVGAAMFMSYSCLLCWRWHTYGKCLPTKCPDKRECTTYFERCCICCKKKPPDDGRPPRGTSAISFTLADERGTPMTFNAEPFIIGKKGLPHVPAPAPVSTSLQKKPKADLTSGHGKWTVSY